MDNPILNKVANSKLITINLEDFYPKEELVELDIKNQLFKGLLLKEKDFREFIDSNDWTAYQNKHVAVFCSSDAIIPSWAWMLLSIALHPFAKKIILGRKADLELCLYQESFNNHDFSQYQDKNIVVKGCGELKISDKIYLEITNRLMPFTKKLMFGEPCSSVPVYRRKK